MGDGWEGCNLGFRGWRRYLCLDWLRSVGGLIVVVVVVVVSVM